ncbi:hypothetical protein Tsubulata_036720, partial [Turnera subulata]
MSPVANPGARGVNFATYVRLLIPVEKSSIRSVGRHQQQHCHSNWRLVISKFDLWYPLEP